MARPPLPRWVLVVIVLLVLAGGAGFAGWAVELPYFAFSPGPVGDVVANIDLADGLESFPPDGELFMLTVAAQEVNVFELLAAGLDPTVDVVRRELIQSPDESDDEFTRRQAALMDDAIGTATTVAFDRLGIDLSPDGVRITAVDPTFPAAEVLEPGDVLREVDGKPILVPVDVLAALHDRSPGDVVTLLVERDGTGRGVDVELGSGDGDSERGFIGVRIGPYFVNPPVSVDPENVGGPSAGLMYTLAMIELLSDGDLAGGRILAGTGTIATDGAVGPVGGIRQKVVAAEAAGAEVMLVPAGNYEEALGAPRHHLELVPVSTVDEALAYLGGAAPT